MEFYDSVVNAPSHYEAIVEKDEKKQGLRSAAEASLQPRYSNYCELHSYNPPLQRKSTTVQLNN